MKSVRPVIHGWSQPPGPMAICHPIVLKGAFIVCCNAAALPMYRLLIYHSATQRTALKFTSLQYRTATYRNAAAVDYERTFRITYGRTDRLLCCLGFIFIGSATYCFLSSIVSHGCQSAC